MLKQRILTALVLLAILLPALFAPTPAPFALVMLVLVAAAGWEWGRLAGVSMNWSLFLGFDVALLCAATWALGLLAQPHLLLWQIATAAWVLGGAALLRLGVAGWPRMTRQLRILGGVLALWAAWLAAVQARGIGINFLLSVLVLVWVADIFGYFFGRALGGRFTRRKLAPTISPNKSWEGVWGGLIGVVILGLVWQALDASLGAAVPSLYSRLMARGWPLLLLGVLFMAAMSVVGDLVESLVKRGVGAKDSSRLLPGHGGVLDRIDALLPTLPIAMMLATT